MFASNPPLRPAQNGALNLLAGSTTISVLKTDPGFRDCALFMAFKEANGGGAWSGWPQPLRKRDPDTLTEAGQRHSDAVERFKFYRNY